VTENRANRVHRLIPALISSDAMQQLFVANTLCNGLINAGFYREALGIRRLVRGVMRSRPTDGTTGLILVNAAESLYNLGRWRAAERVCRSALASKALTGLALDGMRLQLAWVLARTGRGVEAKTWLALTSDAQFPALYRAEVHFTQAAAALSDGDLVSALASVDAGERLAVRMSSKRNAVFLRAEVLMARGDAPGADAAFRVGTASRYRGQGGPSLSLWARCLERLGRPDEAAQARALISERDPQWKNEVARMKLMPTRVL
jgi:hypothetical protein